MIRYLGKKIRESIGGIHYLHKLEKNKIASLPLKNINPPIFIIGAPRSGSTLLYQVLINNFKLSYIPNISSIFYKYSYLITSSSKTLIGILESILFIAEPKEPTPGSIIWLHFLIWSSSLEITAW